MSFCFSLFFVQCPSEDQSFPSKANICLASKSCLLSLVPFAFQILSREPNIAQEISFCVFRRSRWESVAEDLGRARDSSFSSSQCSISVVSLVSRRRRSRGSDASGEGHQRAEPRLQGNGRGKVYTLQRLCFYQQHICSFFCFCYSSFLIGRWPPFKCCFVSV